MFPILVFLLFISIFIEAAIASIPLVFICLLLYIVINKNEEIFPIAFLTGLFLDITTLRTLGSSSLFFLSTFLLVLLYQRKYEISSIPFVAVSSFGGMYLYLLVFNNHVNLFHVVVCSIFALVFFVLGERVKREGERRKNYA